MLPAFLLTLSNLPSALSQAREARDWTPAGAEYASPIYSPLPARRTLGSAHPVNPDSARSSVLAALDDKLLAGLSGPFLASPADMALFAALKDTLQPAAAGAGGKVQPKGPGGSAGGPAQGAAKAGVDAGGSVFLAPGPGDHVPGAGQWQAGDDGSERLRRRRARRAAKEGSDPAALNVPLAVRPGGPRRFRGGAQSLRCDLECLSCSECLSARSFRNSEFPLPSRRAHLSPTLTKQKPQRKRP